jgi:cellobiose phosphorylase
LHYKSPALAMAFSMVIPGSGKIYSGDWKDGLFAMLMIGSMTYESYVGFHTRGTRSVLGWVFAGLSVGFYGGNIYGSYHSAQRYNARQNLNIHNESEKLVISDF